jgi:hypothetical protein
VSASQPLTGDELAAIKARAEAPVCEYERHGDGQCAGSGRGLWCWPCMDARDTLRLVAEVERLRAQVADLERSTVYVADGYGGSWGPVDTS